MYKFKRFSKSAEVGYFKRDVCFMCKQKILDVDCGLFRSYRLLCA